MKASLLIFPIFLLVGCASSKKVLDARWVSMKHRNPPTNQKVFNYVSISEKYCKGTFSSGDVGLIDEVTLQAQKKYGVEYIANAVFMQNGVNCIELTGEGAKRK